MSIATIIFLLALPAGMDAAGDQVLPSLPPPITAERSSTPVTIDGVLDEPVWQRGGYAQFTQRNPNQGELPTEGTEVWVGYDDGSLYIAARLHDASPDSIMQILGRRDVQATADWFSVYIDPYHDRKTGFAFDVSAAGALGDRVLYNDEWDDRSWDGVWEGKARINNDGWTVEMRIPFSQLRFHRQDSYVWGINFRREIGRRNEEDYVVYTPRNESGFVSRFVDLTGITNIPSPRQVEVMPYLNTRADYLQHSAGDPFHTGAHYVPGLGADLKVALGSDLTLDATVNPDYGQVEVDPAVVNLSDVESFFDEKRPFFIEGSNLFDFGRGGSRSYWNFNFPYIQHFYSRRVGRAPHGSTPDADYSDIPIATRILGAAKLTGKPSQGWNLGTIHALTGREYASLESAGARSASEVEPLTYYGVGRVQREFNEGTGAVGAMSTLTLRQFNDDRLRDEMNASALFAGLDGYTFMDADKMWVITGWAGLSRATGTAQQITSLQTNSQHYFQRPDAQHVSVDSTKTSLTGYAMRFWINKQKGHVFSNSAFGIISPGFDVNDAGFIGRSDVINMHTGIGYTWPDPTDWYRSAEIVGSVFRNYDFDGNVTWTGLFLLSSIRFLNYYYLQFNYAYNPQTTNTRRTRGGPLTVNTPGRQFDLSFESDSRKPWIGNFYATTYQADWQRQWYVEGGLQWKPAPNLSVTLAPTIDIERQASQWVDVFDDPTATATYGQRYVFGEMDLTEVAAGIRLNWTFTPELSLQFFAQPLVSSRRFRNFKELARPNSYDFNVFGTETSTLGKNGATYTVDPDGNGPAASFSFDDPDLTVNSFRGNAVLRWEYRPGSTLYLVWTHNRSQDDDNGTFRFGRSISRLWGAGADNVLMLKFTYWWAL